MVRSRSAVFLVLFLSAAGARAGEPAAIGPIDLEQAVTYALGHHPALQAQLATEEARRAQVSVGRAGYLPSLDLSAQVNVGTGNVLRGGLLPMREIPNVSGPPTARDIGDAALGSALCLGIGWDAVGLVRQMAQVDAALAEASQARATSDVEQVAVKRGVALKDLVEVFASGLQAGDLVLKRGSEELKDGAKVQTRAPAADGGAK